MIQSDYLELAIGLAVVFFLGALVVSGLNEGINWLTRVRAKFLWAYLFDLFDDRRGGRALPRGRLGIARMWTSANDKRPRAGGQPVSVDADSVAAAEWLSRLAYALDPVNCPELTGKPGEVLTSIKSVPPASLAQAMLEVFADVGRQVVTGAIGVIADSARDQAAVDAAVSLLMRRLEVPPTVDGRAVVAAFRKALAEVTTTPGADPSSTRRQAADALVTAILPGSPDPTFTNAWRLVAAEWPDVKAETVTAVADALSRAFPAHFARLRFDAAFSKLHGGAPLGPTLRRLWEAAAGQIDGFRTSLEAHLDAEMRRLSGYYRRSIRVVMLGLAAGVVLVGGFDAIDVTRNTWRNPDDRSALVEQADQLANSTTSAPAATEPTAEALRRIQQECAAAHPLDEAEISTPAEAAEAYGVVRTCVNDALDALTGVGVVDQALWVDAEAWRAAWTSAPLSHALGSILAVLALMVGAPFWFDVIKRLTGIRKGLIGDT